MRFEENLNRFRKFSPKEADLVEQASLEGYELCQSQNGSPNIRKKTAVETFYFHSFQNPEQEAKNWFNHLTQIDIIDTLVVFGVGLGYYYKAAKEWLNNKPQRFLIFIEQDAHLLRLFFQTEEAVKILSDPQVILTGIDPKFDNQEKIQFDDLRLIAMILINGSSLLTELSAYKNAYNDLWSMIKKALHYYLRELDWKRSFFTPRILDRVQRNSASNLYALSCSKLLYPMKNTFKDIPAVICGAGSSLEDDIATLKKIKDHALFFGAGTGMNVLNKQQFFPHLGVGIDPDTASSSRILTNYAYETPYCFTLKFNHEALEILHGPKLFFRTNDIFGINTWFEEQFGLDKWERIPCYVSSTYAALSVAKFLGCNPIILLGIDLAYTDNRRYPLSIQTHPLDSEQNHFRMNVLSTRELIQTKDAKDQELLTRADWIREAYEYQNFAKENPAINLINATSRGLTIQGIPHLPFTEVAKEYLKHCFNTRQILESAIVNCPMIEISSAMIKNTISKWIAILEEGEVLLEKMLNIESDQIDSYNAMQAEWKEHPAYKNFLNSIDSCYEFFFFQDQYFFKYRDELFSETELSEKKTAYEKGRIFYLIAYLHIVKRIYVSALKLNGEEIKEKIPSQIPYKNGVLDGTVKLYYPNGKLKREIHFQNGLLNGIERFWDRSGQILLECEYFQNHPQGISKSWHSNGQIKMEKKYHSGEDRYDLRRWNENGKLIEEKIYLLKDFEHTFEATSKDTNERLKKIKKMLNRDE